MKYLDEYRDARIARALAAEIAQRTTRPWVLMEICGGQTHTIMRYGIDELLPPGIELVHGPGCPVCVTPLETVDKAIALVLRPEVILVSYGDMLRVPGSRSDLFRAKAQGADVRIAYSPIEALKIARANPDRKVVFLAIGFETTAPANAMAAWQAKREGLTNFSMLVSHVLVPPAIRALMVSQTNRVQAFIAPGHVCTVVGCKDYEDLVYDFRVPIVVGGFEPVDLFEAILMLVRQLEAGEAKLENQYVRSVSYQGNVPAQKIMAEVFEVADQKWRGIGPCAKNTRRTTRTAFSISANLPWTNPPNASARRFCRDSRSPPTVPPSACAVRRRIPWARPWFRAKAPAPPITTIAGICHLPAMPLRKSKCQPRPSPSSLVQRRFQPKIRSCWDTAAAAN
jgi:hydrogenase expression/formation protein HypD